MKRALVTGATGYIGSNLVRRIVAEGVEVHAAVRPDSDVSALPPEARIHGYSGTAASASEIADAARPDVTFHLASHFRAEHAQDDLESLIAANVAFGTWLVDALCRHPEPRLINTGTSWQHYMDRPYDPVCLYAATKQAFEAMLEFYVSARGLAVTTLKLFDSYGPGDPRKKLVAALFNAAITGQRLELSPGEQRIDLVHVDDVVNAFMIAASRTAADARSESFSVSSRHPVSLRELVALVERVTGKSIDVKWGARPYRDREVMTPWTGGTALPDWRAETGLEEGLRAAWERYNV